MSRFRCDAIFRYGRRGRAAGRTLAAAVALLGMFIPSRGAGEDGPAAALTLSPEAVPYAERSQIRDFTIRVHLSRRPETAPSVQLTLDTGRGDPRHFTAIPDADAPTRIFRVTAPLVPEYLHPQRLRLVASYPSGSVTCTIQDTELEIGKRTLMLSQIRRAECGKKVKVVLDGGETLTSLPTGLQNLRGDLGPVTVTLNLAKADTFTVEPLHPSLASVAYKVEVKEADVVVAERSGEIPVDKGDDNRRAVPASVP